MGLTVTNTNAMNLLNIVNSTSAKQSNTLTQLSTGYKINRGADNPAGLIAMKSLEAELTAVTAAIDNNQRSNAMLAVADNSINEVSSLLGEIETLVMASASDAGLSAGEKAANQAQIDQALASIDRIVNTTNFNGKRLLDGTQAIALTDTVDRTKVDGLRIYSRGTQTSDTQINVSVKVASEVASTGAWGDFSSSDTLDGNMKLEITGALGTKVIEIASGSTASEVQAAINAVKIHTGVSASVNSEQVSLASTGYGSSEFVGVNVLDGGSTAGGNTITHHERTYGQDGTVLINGQSVTTDGLDVYYNSAGISFGFSMDADNLNLANGTGSVSFTIDHNRGGATFQLGTDASTRATLGIDSLATHMLGGGDSGGMLDELKSGGAFDLETDTASALKIVKKAMSDVATAQGRIGAFQKFNVQTSINTLNTSKTSLSEAKSVIADTDFAVATAELNRQSVLLNAGISLLGLANQQASQILSLLG